MLRSFTVIALTACFGGLAAADEVWESADGSRIVYERDEGGYAVLSGPGNVLYYIDGLAGNYSDRQGVFAGHWFVENGQPDNNEDACRAGYRGSLIHGEVGIQFDTPAFPSGFEMARRYCDGPVNEYGHPQELIITFHHYLPVTNVRTREPEIDTGFNDSRPGMNQQYECIDRLRNFVSGFADARNLRGRFTEPSQTWRVSGTIVYRSGYQRSFDCFHANGQVERIVFGQQGQ